MYYNCGYNKPIHENIKQIAMYSLDSFLQFKFNLLNLGRLYNLRWHYNCWLNIGGTLLCTAMPLAEVATNENEAPGGSRRLADVLDDWQGDIYISLRAAGDTHRKQLIGLSINWIDRNIWWYIAQLSTKCRSN